MDGLAHTLTALPSATIGASSESCETISRGINELEKEEHVNQHVCIPSRKRSVLPVAVVTMHWSVIDTFFDYQRP